MTIMPNHNKKEQRRKTILQEVKRRQTRLTIQRAHVTPRRAPRESGYGKTPTNMILRGNVPVIPEVPIRGVKSETRESYGSQDVKVFGSSAEF